MLNLSLVFIEVAPPPSAVFIVILSLMLFVFIVGCIYIYRDRKSYQRQGKRWIWYQRPHVVLTCMVALWIAITIFEWVQVTSIHTNLFITIPFFILLGTNIALSYYYILTIAGKKKEEAVKIENFE